MPLENTSSVAPVQSIVPLRYYVATGKNRVTVEAKTAREAAEEAIERIVSDDSRSRSMGQLTQVSKYGFHSDADDDVFMATESLMEAIGFRRNDEGDLVRCMTCRGVGRVDCCDKLDCLDCGGLFTKDCPHC
jgi:hypothetical protein